MASNNNDMISWSENQQGISFKQLNLKTNKNNCKKQTQQSQKRMRVEN